MSLPIYQFGKFRLDCAGLELLRDGKGVRLERKPLELLILLVSSHGHLVKRSEIAERLWSSEVFVDTDHGINTAIRKLRRLLEDDAENAQYIQTVTGAGYRFIAPVVTVESPDGESTPVIADTTVSNELASAPPAAVPSRRRWIVLSALAVVLLALLVVAMRPHTFLAHALRGDAAPAISSIAVLPLENLSGDPKQDYFADGMTDELITMLAKDTNLRVTSRTSVMQYKDVHEPLRDIARSLNVDGILEGSVSRSADHVHLTLQLIRADTDAHFWAESYDRDVNDTALPNEAALAIAQRLHSVAAINPPVQVVSPAAHDAFLRGKNLWFTGRVLESGDYFRKATELQPNYAEAWAWLAAYYGEAVGGSVVDPRTNLQPLWDTAQRALQLGPNLADSHWVMGAAYFLARWDWANADRELQRAISLDPQNAEYYYLRAIVLETLGRFDEAIASEKKAMELDPFERPDGMAAIYTGARQYDAALADLRVRMQASPNDADLMLQLWDTLRRKGDYKAAMEVAAKWYIAIGDPRLAEESRQAYEKGGARSLIRWGLERHLALSKTQYISPEELASYYAQLGERDQAIAQLDEAYRQHAPELVELNSDPAFDFLRSDPRFRSLVQQIGLPSVQ